MFLLVLMIEDFEVDICFIFIDKNNRCTFHGSLKNWRVKKWEQETDLVTYI